jgi:hypothetical protein
MWPFKKNRFKKLQKSEVVNSIIALNQREEDFETNLLAKQEQVKELYQKGQAEKDPNIRLFYAKKINFLKEDIQNTVQRNMYVLYNLRLLNRLKDALEDKEFIASVGNESLSDLLGDQKHLAQFLNQALNTKIKAEDVLTNADDTFNEVQSVYTPDERIYGINKNDDKTMSMFELGDQLSLESESDDPSSVKVEKEPEAPIGEGTTHADPKKGN